MDAGSRVWQRIAKIPYRPRWVLIGLAVVATLAVLFSCFRPASLPLRIGANLWTGYETLYLARDLGELKDKPIRLIDFPSGTEEVRAYRNDEIDGAGLSIDQVITLAATQGDIRIIAIMDFSNGGDVILARPGLRTMAELKGKRIGVEATALGAFFLGRALELNDMTPQDVTVVSLELGDHEAAYRAGRVDAVVTFGPPRINLLKAGAIPLFDSRRIPGEIVDTLAASSDAIANNAENLQALVEARFKALDYFQSNPAEAARRMARRTRVEPQELLEAFDLLEQPSLETNVALLTQRDPSLVVSMTNLIRVMHDHGLITTTRDPASLLDAQFVERALARR
ncbi:ABC transporter substrate-binding protein [Cyanobium sp. Copco_Reservoir_LC18]|uniref:ABC transporter substrate-binding protein n=1 Tax=Cyanobium sp. Copco_Reservoir_LC18 TaxID=1328305 RepID=UPI001359D8E4|nr:ABC transporter substrate-binding protein [Cyanobium sp. Copco_Reservoir_LC18]